MSHRKRTDLLVIHVTATPVTFNMTNAKLRAMHKRRGFSDIGYNEWIDRKGKLHNGRGVDKIGAHVAGYNSRSYGISLEGGHKKADATPAMMETLEKRLRELIVKYPNAKICGHRDLSPDGDGDGVIEPHEHTKQCPWFDAIPWARSKGLPAADIKGVWASVGKQGPDARDRWLQKLLRGKGYLVVADGIIGPATEEQIRQFQEDVNLPVTGKFDKATVIKLKAPASPVKASKDVIAAGGAVAVPVVVTAVAEPSYIPYVMMTVAVLAFVGIGFLIWKGRKNA